MNKKIITLIFTSLVISGCGKSNNSNKTSSTNKITSSLKSEISSSSSLLSSKDDTSSFTSSSSSLTNSSTSSNEISSSSSSSTSTSSSTISSSSSSSTNSSSSEEILGTITKINNIDDINWHKGDYFDPLQGVSAFDSNGNDITSFIKIQGSVNYGKDGTYTLKYILNYNNETYEKVRNVSISSSHPKYQYELNSIKTPSSDKFAVSANIEHPLNPDFVAPYLRNKGIKTNSWWSPLTCYNRGGGSGIYTNPLKSSFTEEGVEVTNPGEGFTQFWDSGTQAQFSVAYKDLIVGNKNLNNNYQTQVISYSDNSCQVSMKGVSNEDEMVVSYSQGSPFIFFEVKDPLAPFINLDINGVDNYSFYALDGELISDSSYTSDSLIVKFNHRHIGYDCQKPNVIIGPCYEDRYFLINAPEATTFELKNKKSPGGFFDQINLNLGTSNLFSIAAVKDIEEANLLHEYGYSLPLRSNSSFNVNHDNSLVTSYFRNNILATRFNNDGALYLLPHQYKNSSVSLTSNIFKTVRGSLKLALTNNFTTTQSFKGVLPTLTKPLNSEFDKETLSTYFLDLKNRVESDDEYSLYNSTTPYWNGKILHSLANGIIQADQIGNSEYKEIFLDKLETLLKDWFNYSSSSDSRYLYYNSSWGSMYYSNNDFDTAKTLSDHHFTHGYLVYASAIAMMFDENYKKDYLDITTLLLKDYLNYDREDDSFPYLRGFDSYASHSWASGLSIFAEGNNQESSGEALNSWVGGYLLGLTSGNEKLVDTAIYGYVSELNAIKNYWFNYDNDIFTDKYKDGASCAGMIWGGKYDYATWFGADPTFIYGIHFLPISEYLTSYALGSEEKTTLTSIYNSYLNAKNGSINTWFSNMWSIGAVCNPQTQINKFEASKILNDDYPNEVSNAYYFINAMKTYNLHEKDVELSLSYNTACSVYSTNGSYTALCYNPTSMDSEIKITIKGKVVTLKVSKNSFKAYSL